MTDKTDKPSLGKIAEKDSAARAGATKKPGESKPAMTGGKARSGKRGGGFVVWFVLLLAVAGGAVVAGWPYVGPMVEPVAGPVIADVRDLLGLTPRPTQARLPRALSDQAAPAPIAEAASEAMSEPMPAPAPEPVVEPVVDPVPQPEPAAAPQPMADASGEQVALLAQRLDALENQILTLGAMSGAEGQAALEATTELARSLSSLKNDIAELSARLAALEEGARADPTAPAQALVLGVTQLRSQLLGDGPFAAELDALDSIAGGDAMVAEQVQHLRPHADVGVPTEAALTARFAKVAKDVMTARATSEAGGWLGKVKEGLGGLVTVRRTDPAAITDQVERAVAVAEAALELGELADAVEALSSLEGAPGDAVAAWLGDARARAEAEAALEALHRHALAMLAATGGA